MAKKKKKMNREEEFEILKLVLDKFLWLGVGLMAYGFYKMISWADTFWYGLAVLLGGALLLMVFTVILLREYHVSR